MHSFFSLHNRTARAWCVGLFFLAWLALGLSIYKDYGISWDEITERNTGIVSVNFIGERLNIAPIINNETLSKYQHIKLDLYHDRVFGPLFGIVSAVLERIFHIGQGWNEREIFQFRHLLTFLVVVAGGFAIFRLSERRFGDWRLGLLTLTLFILSPRFFAESFYNNKDLVFLACFAIATNCMIRLVLQPNALSALMAAFAAAIVIDIRITGIILPTMTFTLLLLRALKGENPWGSTVRAIVVYLLIICGAVVLMWPWLWGAPLTRFLEALAAFSRWVRSDSVLFFMGRFIRSTNLPWEYAPVWIAVTTPLLYLGTFFIGTLSTIASLLRNRLALWKTPEQMQDLIFLGICCCPVLAVIFLHSVIYDGWRHLYFIYPAMLLLATQGCLLVWAKLHQYRGLRTATLTLFIGGLLWNATWIARAHPLQNVYFNTLAGSDWKSKFDVDYWGLANQIALEKILEHDTQSIITIYAGSDIDLNIAVAILRPQDRARFIVVNRIEEANYILTNYRANLTVYDRQYSELELFYQIKVDGEIIESIYKNLGRKKPGEEINLREPISFKDIKNSRSYLMGLNSQNPKLSNWSSQEEWGVWSAGEFVEIRLPLSNRSLQNARELNINFNALVNPKHPEQKISLYINGMAYKEIRLTKAKNNLVVIPLTTKELSQSILTIKIELPDRARPKDLGIGNDDRQLAIGITSAVFR